MNNVDKFLKSICSFSNSLVIKFEDLAYQTEQYARKTMTPDIDDKLFWKYYENISGNFYPLDETPYIKVIETEELEPLSLELLNKYPMTKRELIKGEDYYLDLISSYPTQTMYIHGCLYPVDKEVAASAEDGTILAYNKDFLQDQEDNIIEELESFTKTFFTTYYNTRYSITDELYIPAVMGVLYSLIPYKILNIMFSNIKTYRANTFFLELYYRSKFDMWDNLQALKNKETIWWLYSNLDRIIKNIGKNETLDLILNNVFDKDNIGVGSNYLKYKDPVISNEPYNPTVLPYDTEKPQIFMDKLNKSFLQHDNKTNTLSTILDFQLDLSKSYNSDRKEYIKDSIIKTLSERNYGTNLTKTLDLSTLENFTGWNLDIYTLLLDYWTWFLNNDMFGSFTNNDITTVKVDFLDPNTKRKYNINSKQAYYMFIKLILKASNKENIPLNEISVSSVLDPNVNLDYVLMVKLYQDGYTQLHKDYIRNNYPIPSKTYSSYLDVSEFLNKVIKFYKDIWILSSNSENAAVSGNLRMLLYSLVKQEKIKIHTYKDPKTIDELLADQGVTFEVSGQYDYMASIKELLKNVLGITTDPNAKLEDLLNNLMQLFNKLTSYTLQIKGSIKNNENVYVFYNNLQPFITKKGIIKLDETRFNLEPNAPNGFLTRFVPHSGNKPMAFVFESNPILNLSYRKQMTVIGSDEPIADLIPSAAVYGNIMPTMHIEDFKAYGQEVELFGVYKIEEGKRSFEINEVEKVLNAEEITIVEGNKDLSVSVIEEITDENQIVLPDFITTKD